jgi:hypothetical protein
LTTVVFAPLPSTAAWSHRDARDGFEIVAFPPPTGADPSIRLRGSTAAVEAGEAWAVDYDIVLHPTWRTIGARIRGWSAGGEREVTLARTDAGRWQVAGSPRPDLDGCVDIDLESSACTNTIPVHRLALDVGAGADAPAVYVRAVDLSVQRLEQTYVRVADQDGHQRYDYRAPSFDFAGRLTYDASGLVVTYPGLATRAL